MVCYWFPMIKSIVLSILCISTLLFASTTTKTKNNFYIKDNRKIYKAIQPDISKPMINKVKAHEYKTPVVKGVIEKYSK